MTTHEAAVYEFGEFRMDVRERQLLRRGRPIPVTGKVFDTLRVMLERAGRLVTKDELIQQLWPDTVVEENNLNQNISAVRKALGEQASGERYIETVPRVGYRFVAALTRSGAPTAPLPPAAASARTERQDIRFCTTPDGVRIAYSSVGSGRPLVKTGNWLTHIEHEWDSPVWKHWIHAIGAHHQLVRWDERGCGLSDWYPDDLSLDAWVRDAESVVDALQLERFALLGISQGGAVAAAYAARHPERVSHLVLCGAYTCGWRHRADARELETRSALLSLTRLGWGQDNPAFRQMFTARFIPDGGPEQMQWFNDLQRVSTPAENAARLMNTLSELDVRPLLGTIAVPTIVFHSREDGVVPFEEGRRLAASIPGSRFVPLPSRNHLVLEHELAWGVFLRELGAFLGWSAVNA